MTVRRPDRFRFDYDVYENSFSMGARGFRDDNARRVLPVPDTRGVDAPGRRHEGERNRRRGETAVYGSGGRLVTDRKRNARGRAVRNTRKSEIDAARGARLRPVVFNT